MRELTIGMSNDALSHNEKSIMMVELTELAKEFGNATFLKTGMEVVAFGNGGNDDKLVLKKGDLVYIDGEWKEINCFLEEQGEDKIEPVGVFTGLTDYVDNMINQNLSSAASISAFASRLTYRLERLYNEEENATAALSRIEDIDIVEALVEFVKEKILAQSALAMAAQANTLPKHVLSLLESLPKLA